MKKFTRIVRYIFIALIVYVAIVIAPLATFNRGVNMNAMPSNYKKGVYHMHTIYSDGAGTMEDIARAAINNKIDFAIVTDHGEPNLKCMKSTAWHQNTLIIGGSELSLSCGHLAAAGFPVPADKMSREPQMSIDQLNSYPGSVSFVAHPYDTKIPWTDWSAKDFTGLEIASIYSFAKNEGASSLATFPIRYMFNSDYALTSLLSYPERNMKKWDELNKKGVYQGIFALDVHGHLPVTKNFSLMFPSYSSMFRIFNIYVKIDRALEKSADISAATIISAIKKGRFFNVVEAYVSANGFDSSFIHMSGEITEMGSRSSDHTGEISLKMPFNFKTRVRILRNGELYKEIKENYDTSIKIGVNKPGVYRTEIYYDDNDDFPWIVTNPFFLGTAQSTEIELKSTDKSERASSTPVDLSLFNIEKNPESQGSITRTPEEITIKSKLKSGGKKNFWVSASMRKNCNWSDAQALSMDIKGTASSHIWVEMRTKKDGRDLWFKKSVMLKSDWNNITIPLSSFIPVGHKNKPDLDSVYALFISTNDSTSYSGASKEMSVKNMLLIKNAE